MNKVASINQSQDESDAGNTVSHVWNTDTLEKVQEFANTWHDSQRKRKAINDKLAAGQSGLVELGMNKDAIKAAISYAKTPEEDRQAWDETYIFVRKSLGCPIQEDLFVAAMQDEVHVSREAQSKKED